MHDETPDYESIDYPELPSGWEWQSGETSMSYYTHWFGTEYQMGGPHAGEYGLGGFTGEVFWDKGQKHTVTIRAVKSIDSNGDPIYGYDEIQRTFDTMQEAVNAVPEIIREL